MDLKLKDKPWWNSLEEGIQELLTQSQHLINKTDAWETTFHDYAFIVFPAAKAYEGFLKKLFLDMGFITPKDYSGKRFRVGKALNPHLDKRYRNESVYDRLKQFCNGQALPDQLWDTWKQGRNIIFHWFPNEKNAISLKEAKERVAQIVNAIDMAHATCKIDYASQN